MIHTGERRSLWLHPFCRKTLPNIWRPRSSSPTGAYTCGSWMKRSCSSRSISLPRPCWSLALSWKRFSPAFGKQRDSENRQRMERWFELRNCVAEAQAPAVTLDPARKRVEDVRASLTRESKVGPRLAPMKAPAEASRQVRGKYQFVPTSSAEFIGRKADVPIGGNEAGSAAGRRRGDRGVRSGRRRGALRRGVGGRGIGDPTGGDSGGSRDRLLRVGNRCQKRNWQAGRLVAGLNPLFG